MLRKKKKKNIQRGSTQASVSNNFEKTVSIASIALFLYRQRTKFEKRSYTIELYYFHASVR